MSLSGSWWHRERLATNGAYHRVHTLSPLFTVYKGRAFLKSPCCAAELLNSWYAGFKKKCLPLRLSKCPELGSKWQFLPSTTDMIRPSGNQGGWSQSQEQHSLMFGSCIREHYKGMATGA